MRRLLTTLMVAFAAMTALAQGSGRIYIEDFEIARDSTVTVTVMLTNNEPTQGLQFNMRLPQGLEVDEVLLTKYSRKLKMNVSSNLKGDTMIVAVYPMAHTFFAPDTAGVLTMEVTATPQFEGGNITFWKSQGSSEQFTSIFFDDSSATVTLLP